ncbi:MAG: hypothetical protein FWH46_01320 [Methanimicrococcus sp.]|nr:hypothetical protein [Methanimicrococcus sp.]
MRFIDKYENTGVTEYDNIDSFSVNTIEYIPMFHGTYRESVDAIISAGFQLSEGSKQHLGKGIYFFDSENFAIWWKFKSEKSIDAPIEKLINGINLTQEQLYVLLDEFLYKFGVIRTTLHDVKILDLDNVRHKELFNKIYEKCYEKSSKDRIFETTIYDIMFEKMGFNKRFDGLALTENLFKRRDIPYLNRIAPQSIIPYRVYCIKNVNKIDNCCECLINTEHIDNCLRYIALRKKAYDGRR